MKDAKKAKKTFIPICEASPLQIWNTLPQIINTIIAKAVICVILGFKESITGAMIPIPPSKSMIPVNFTTATGTSAVQGHIADNFSIDRNSFSDAPHIKLMAKIIFAIQTAIRITFECFGFSFWEKLLLRSQKYLYLLTYIQYFHFG